jgi:hypothetical protein
MLFVLVMECFSALVTTVEARGIFLPLGMSVIKHHISLYVDDVVMYRRSRQTFFLLRPFWIFFFRATGLVANFVKSQVFPIRCDERYTDMIS